MSGNMDWILPTPAEEARIPKTTLSKQPNGRHECDESSGPKTDHTQFSWRPTCGIIWHTEWKPPKTTNVNAEMLKTNHHNTIDSRTKKKQQREGEGHHADVGQHGLDTSNANRGSTNPKDNTEQTTKRASRMRRIIWSKYCSHSIFVETHMWENMAH